MVSKKHLVFRLATLAISVLFISALALAQTEAGSTTTTNSGTSSSTSASGQKMKIKGVVTQHDGDTFVVKDASGAETSVRMTSQTSVKTKGGIFHGGTTYAQSNILRGLNLEVEGR